MNWDSVSAVSELIAAVAVVVSLIYIAAQVRSGAETFKTTLRDSAFNSLMEYNYALLADPELGWIFQEGMRDLDALDDKQRARAFHVMYSFFKLFENMYLHYLEGSVDENVWINNRQILFVYAGQSGARKYLSARMPIFAPEYRELLQGADQAEIKPYREI